LERQRQERVGLRGQKSCFLSVPTDFEMPGEEEEDLTGEKLREEQQAADYFDSGQVDFDRAFFNSQTFSK
jgi:hypothetical protein